MNVAIQSKHEESSITFSGKIINSMILLVKLRQPEDIANHFNEYFTRIGPTLAEKNNYPGFLETEK